MSAGASSRADGRHRQRTRPRRGAAQGQRPGAIRRRLQLPRHALRRAGRRHHRQRCRDGDRNARARQMPGVRAVFKRGDLGPMSRITPSFAELYFMDESRPPLDDDIVRYYGQYVALVVADTFEQAKAAADAVAVSYAANTPNVDPHLVAEKTKVQSERGDADAGFAGAAVTIDAALCDRAGDPQPDRDPRDGRDMGRRRADLYETSQGVVNHRNVLADMLGLPRDKVRVISRFIGSGFGSKLFPWTQSPLAAAAAMALGRPVKLVLSRPMMFQAVGHRPRIEQRVRLGATADGKLVSLQHDYVNATSILDDYEENCGEATPHMYSVPNLRVTSGLAKRNIGTPTSMRGPGAVPGLFATRIRHGRAGSRARHGPGRSCACINEPAIDEGLGVPFSSRHFQECLTLGAEKFGWSRRNPQVGSMQRDGVTLGWGMAACSWLAAALRLHRVGRAARRRNGARGIGGPGHRHRHLHCHGADGGGAAGHPDGAGRGRAGRHAACRRGPSPAARCSTASLVAPIQRGHRRRRPGADRRRGRARTRHSAAASASDLAFSRRPCGRQGGQPRSDGVRRAAAGAEDQVASPARARGEGTFGRRRRSPSSPGTPSAPISSR